MKILSLLERKISNKIHIILPTIPSVCCCTTLRKLEVRVLAYLEENAYENITCIKSFEQSPKFNALRLLTYLLFQFPVLVKYPLLIADDFI